VVKYLLKEVEIIYGGRELESAEYGRIVNGE
jgi:hypothetical protein